MEFDRAQRAEDCRVFCLRRPRAELHARIAERVDRMFADGFVNEVRHLMTRWEGFGRTAAQAVGYQEVVNYLDGQMTLDDAKEQTLIRTRRFARHQETWFRGLSECQIIDIRSPADDSQQIAQSLYELGRARALK
jgi:tRNA dimethylallyltransferase